MDRPGSELINKDIAHFGIKGMHWGVRRAAQHPSSSDATRAKATAHIVKKHGTHAVSNKELQDLVTRMNLEQQYSQLSSKSATKRVDDGQKYVKKVLEVAKTVNEVISFVNSPTGKLIRSQIAKNVKK